MRTDVVAKVLVFPQLVPQVALREDHEVIEAFRLGDRNGNFFTLIPSALNIDVDFSVNLAARPVSDLRRFHPVRPNHRPCSGPAVSSMGHPGCVRGFRKGPRHAESTMEALVVNDGGRIHE